MVRKYIFLIVVVSLISISLSSCSQVEPTIEETAESLFLTQDFEEKKTIYSEVVKDENLIAEVKDIRDNKGTSLSDEAFHDAIICEYIFSYLLTDDYDEFELQFWDAYTNGKFKNRTFYGVYLSNIIYVYEYNISQEQYLELDKYFRELYEYDYEKFINGDRSFSINLIANIGAQQSVNKILGNNERLQELKEIKNDILTESLEE